MYPPREPANGLQDFSLEITKLLEENGNAQAQQKVFSFWTDLLRFFPFTQLANVYTTETGMGTGKSAFDKMLSHCLITK